LSRPRRKACPDATGGGDPGHTGGRAKKTPQSICGVEAVSSRRRMKIQKETYE
jgi:hypothetical protein